MTTRLPVILDLAIVGVADVGVPGLERIGLRPMARVNLGEFIITLGFQTGPQQAIPYANVSIWLGEIIIEPPAWVIVFTGPVSCDGWNLSFEFFGEVVFSPAKPYTFPSAPFTPLEISRATEDFVFWADHTTFIDKAAHRGRPRRNSDPVPDMCRQHYR